MEMQQFQGERTENTRRLLYSIFVYFLFSLAMGFVYSNYYSLNFISYIFGKRLYIEDIESFCSV